MKLVRRKVSKMRYDCNASFLYIVLGFAMIFLDAYIPKDKYTTFSILVVFIIRFQIGEKDCDMRCIER
jgi:hypothetical protein